jgi:hypothetical protein
VSDINDQLDAEATDAAVKRFAQHLKATVLKQNPNKLLKNLSGDEARHAVQAAIGGFIAKRAEQCQAERIDPGDWNDFIDQRGAYAPEQDPVDDLPDMMK